METKTPKSRVADMKVRRIVAYADPKPDEMYKGDPIVYCIVEDRGERVLMEDVWINRTGFKPQVSALKSELRIAFVEHCDILVPDFINFDEWDDCSWHNDATASVSKPVNDGSGLTIRLWIFHQDPDKRETPSSRYWICYEDPDGHMTIGQEADTDEDAIALIKSYEKVIKSRVKEDMWL